METNKELGLNNGETVPPTDTNTISTTESEVANIIISEFQQSLEGEHVAMVETTNILTENNDSAASESKVEDMEVDEPIAKELEQVKDNVQGEPMLETFNESNEDSTSKQDDSADVAMDIEQTDQILETVHEVPSETIVETEEPHQETAVQHDMAIEQHEDSSEQHVESIEQQGESIEQHEVASEQHEVASEQHEESVEQHEAAVEQYEFSIKDDTPIEQLESSTEQLEQHEETVIGQLDQATGEIHEITESVQETESVNIQVIEDEIDDHKDMDAEEHEQIDDAKVDECKSSEDALYNQESNGTEDEEELEEYEEITQEGTVLVVASGEPEMKEIVVRTPDGREGTVTVQQVTDENGQVYLVETMDNVIVMDDDGSHHVEHVENAPRPKVPSHVLGRNIENPSVDPFRNGKAPPKPRLGVKIPYRNLTSQIVSKQEITAEIMERSKRCSKQSPSGQNLFAKRLTQTLAKKLAPSKKKSVGGSTPHIIKKEQFNNSDLIAILEGDGDDPEPEIEAEPEVPEPEEPFIMTKEMERAIALKQLRELPDDPPIEAKRPVPLKKDEFTFSKEDDIEKSLKQIEEVPNLRKIKRNRTDLAREDEDDIPKPTRFTSSVPLKTYTRKRKQSEEVIPEPKSNVPSPTKPVTDSTKKIDLPSNSKNYVTKSSRIIKKKIIWDPDEVSPKKMLKTGENNKDRLISVVRKEVSSEDKKLVAIKKLKEEDVKKTTDVKKCEKNEVPKKVDGSKKLQTSPKTESPKPEKKILVKPASPHKLDSKLTSEKLAALKGKKRPTEVDKLLMDEGAVNMLYSFKNSDDDSKTKKVNKSLMSKTNELLNDLQTNTDKVSPKALRKKDGTPIQLIKTLKKSGSPAPITAMSRQKSRDSVRSSIYSSPGSPGSNADASRIIRRHSSSSFSSEDDNESDMEDDEEIKVKVREVREVRAIRRKADTSLDTIKKRRKEKDDSQDIEHNEAQFNKLVDSDDDKYDDFKTFTVKKVDQVVEIILHCNDKDNVYLKIEMMQEISIILKELEQDAECNVAYITSSGNSFMKGIKYKSLVAQKEITRKNLAKKMATSVRDFLLALANFPKLIVAGVHGNNIGLGVTMLPLFDMVVSNSSATFHIPNADIGCMVEGGSLLLLPHLSQNVLISELLFVSQKLEASEALKLGLVSKVLEADSFEENVNELLIILSTKSAQFMEATKKQLRNRMIPDITAALNSETENLVQQWISSECQKNFSDI